jgi:ComF family protein
VKGFFRFVIDCVFPRKCVSCGCFTGGSLICPACMERLERADGAGRLPGGSGIPVISPFITGDVLLDMIRFLKFSGGTAAAGWLGREMSAAAGPYVRPLADPLVIPVPLHWTRLARRGYDQAELLAAAAARRAGIPISRRVLRRQRMTRPQSSLGGEERGANVGGAFRIRRSSILRGRDIILVDDLVTTGGTVSACCRALGEAHPSSIAVLCAGRAKAPKKLG